ncbi:MULTISPECIES: class I SAM-dependent methyltransferase [Peribacillus]|uniref:class I SAM-dependent methyltransferase n=1 Tax=Peribacillus TaxID=2675229 RepID=UPI001F4E5FC3|nr:MULTISPECIES: class I SAM-dependent methyltransferase [unclassified Peribacillus]MCK1983136.1 methyltransferase domain-containing protein [Peribacillus sp. Aquil_B1]MCK2009238.1 methyltransferase domain-containing protein [Peribacillus sp. Aquil_B8]
MNHSYQDALAILGIEGAHPGGFELTKQLLENEKIDHTSIILDAGCGTGQTSSYLAKTFLCQVSALDHHPEMLKHAKRRFQKANLSIDLYKSSIEELPFDNNSFDFIIAESATAFTDIKKSLREFYRVLKLEGTLLSIDMTAETSLDPASKKEIMDFYHLRELLTQSEWLKAFKQNGFTDLKILRSSTVLEELMNSSASNNLVQHVNESLERVMAEHYRLILSYGNSLGYRVYRASKK